MTSPGGDMQGMQRATFGRVYKDFGRSIPPWTTASVPDADAAIIIVKASSGTSALHTRVER